MIYFSRILRFVNICHKYGIEEISFIDFQETVHNIRRNSPWYFLDVAKSLIARCREIHTSHVLFTAALIPMTFP